MVKDLAAGAIILAQSIAMPYDGTWQVGNFCDPTDYDAHLTIYGGKASSDGGTCVYVNITPASKGGYNITARCHFQDEPNVKNVRIILRATGSILEVFDGDTGILRDKLTRCNG